jgi:superfamily II DNA helicase RecQ
MHREGASALDRKTFEAYVGALEALGLILIQERDFEKDGRTIPYRTAQTEFYGTEAELIERLASLHLSAAQQPNTRPRKRGSRLVPSAPSASKEAPPGLVTALKSWRLSEARKRAVPAFTILSDRTLMGIAETAPRTADELRSVRGMGPRLVEKHGAEILQVLSSGHDP